MQAVLKQRRYTQIPQLSSSRQVKLTDEKFSVFHPQATGRTKALLIGINYTGHQQGELSGCVNDVRMMKRFIEEQGFRNDKDSMKILTDDPHFSDAAPTGQNIIAAMRWLVMDAQPGDSLFFHYSGHGGQMPDDNGDEADGMDETLIPVDYQTGGQIRDDLIYKLLVAPLPADVHLLSVFDCCHSGTILDLPYIFSATDQGVSAVQGGQVAALGANPSFNWEAAFAALAEVARGFLGGLSKTARDLFH